MRPLLVVLLSLGLGPLLALALVARLGSLVAERSVGVLSARGQAAGGDLGDSCVDVVVVDDGENVGGLGSGLAIEDGLGVGLAGVTLLDLACAAREDNKAADVLLETLDIDCQRLLGQVLTAAVDADADSLGVLASNSGSLFDPCQIIPNRTSGTIPPTFSSSIEKPRPARSFMLYLTVGQRTAGRSLSTGRGASFAALVTRALRRRCFLPGYSTALAISSETLSSRGIKSLSYLVEMCPDPTLPILAEICVCLSSLL